MVFKPANKYRRFAGAAGDTAALEADRRKRTYQSTVYSSIRERRHAELLDLLASAKDPREQVTAWDRQVWVPLTVNGVRVCAYVVDFRVMYGDGRIEYHEVKGQPTETWRIKEKLFRAIYPERTLKIIR